MFAVGEVLRATLESRNARFCCEFDFGTVDVSFEEGGIWLVLDVTQGNETTSVRLLSLVSEERRRDWTFEAPNDAWITLEKMT